MNPPLLSPEAISEHLKTLPDWELEEGSNEIIRTFTFANFKEAMSFAQKVGELAESHDHHPDILIEYKNVTLALTTHCSGGLTERDFKLAGEIEGLVK